MKKSGHTSGEVNTELRAAIQEDVELVSPNYASKMAHLFLGTEDSRQETKPQKLYDDKARGSETLESSKRTVRRGSWRTSLIEQEEL